MQHDEQDEKQTKQKLVDKMTTNKVSKWMFVVILLYQIPVFFELGGFYFSFLPLFMMIPFVVCTIIIFYVIRVCRAIINKQFSNKMIVGSFFMVLLFVVMLLAWPIVQSLFTFPSELACKYSVFPCWVDYTVFYLPLLVLSAIMAWLLDLFCEIRKKEKESPHNDEPQKTINE